MDTSVLRRWATPLTIGTFVLMGVTGILMFFEVHIGIIKLAHEWLSWLMVIAVALHVILHWKSFSRYFSQKASVAVIALFAVITIASLLIPNNGGERRGPPPGAGGSVSSQATEVLLAAPLATLANLTQQTPETLLSKLEQQGLEVDSDQATVEHIADENHRNPTDVLNSVLQK